jgi:hypothetical protein
VSCTGTTHATPASLQPMSQTTASPHFPSDPHVCCPSLPHLVALGLHSGPGSMGTEPPAPPLPIAGAPPAPAKPPPLPPLAPEAPPEPPEPLCLVQATLISPPPAVCVVPSGQPYSNSPEQAPTEALPTTSRMTGTRKRVDGAKRTNLCFMPFDSAGLPASCSNLGKKSTHPWSSKRPEVKDTVSPCSYSRVPRLTIAAGGRRRQAPNSLVSPSLPSTLPDLWLGGLRTILRGHADRRE